MKTTQLMAGILSVCLPLCFTQPSRAESEPTSSTPDYTARHTIYLSAGEVALDSKIADSEGVGDKPTYVRFAWEAQKHTGIFGAGMSIFMYSDHESFSQRVERNYGGGRSTESSSAEAVNLYGEGGYSHQATDNVYFDILGGYELVLQSERSISYCSDCYSEDIDVDSGLYITPRMKVIADNGFTFLLAYHHYLSGDAEQGLSVGLGYTF